MLIWSDDLKMVSFKLQSDFHAPINIINQMT